jgi:hypothetical protein
MTLADQADTADTADTADVAFLVRACPCCEQENGPMGRFGSAHLYRCRACGADYMTRPANRRVR